MTFVRILILFSFGTILWGCVTEPKYRDPSEYLLNTDRDAEGVLGTIRTKLEENTYKIKKQDTTAGLLVVRPRKFSYDQNGKTVVGKQDIQVRLEGGSIKLRIFYQCNYAGYFERCMRDDLEAEEKLAALRVP